MDIWFVSDTHFGHANFLKFLDLDGNLVRRFSCVEEMDELMVERWNERVKDHDRVYHLGDVTFDYQNYSSSIAPRLRGSKRLLLGNHDIIKGTNLIAHFKKVQLWRLFKDEGIICTHVPLHEGSFGKARANVHGHIHERSVGDPRYINVCVEQTDYRPLHFDEVLAKLN